MTLVSAGPHAWLLRFAEAVSDEAFQRGRALVAWLDQQPLNGLKEIVPALTTILLEFEPGKRPSAESILAKLTALGEWQGPETEIKEIKVHYDGPDLSSVAETVGLSREEVIARHTAPIYRVHALGFSPGFPYLGGLDPVLHLPRLHTPRTQVPAGSVAIGGEHTGIYSVNGPGGWHLLGRTQHPLFDPTEKGEAMFWLRCGDRIRFVAE